MNILVTGGTSGVGKAVVEHLAAGTDHTVFFTYCNQAAVAQSLVRQYPNTVSFQCDFANAGSVERLLVAIEGWNLDVLVNNAYAGHPQGLHFHKQPVTDFLESFRINILPVISITRQALATFREKKAGRIITILSAALFNLPPAGYSLYAANKAYIGQLAKSWSKEYIKYGITSNCISPDFMETPLTGDTDPRVVEQWRAGHPLKRILTPDEVAQCVGFLVSAPAHINGVNIPMNAGTAVN